MILNVYVLRNNRCKMHDAETDRPETSRQVHYYRWTASAPLYVVSDRSVGRITQGRTADWQPGGRIDI